MTDTRDEGRTHTCKLCGHPMPEGEKMFAYHGYSGPCPTDATGSEDKDDREWLRERLRMFTDRLASCSGPEEYTAALTNEVRVIEQRFAPTSDTEGRCLRSVHEPNQWRRPFRCGLPEGHQGICAPVERPTSDTEDAGEEELLMECANCGQLFDWTDDIQSTFHERACGEIGSLYPNFLPAMSARLRRTPETEALRDAYKREAVAFMTGDDDPLPITADDLVGIFDRALATQDPDAGGEDE